MDNLLDSLLNENPDDLQTTEKEDEVLKPLSRELQLISDENVLSFVRAILYHVDERFWRMPSSTRMDENPPDEYGEAGNILHTRRVTRIAAQLALAQGVTEKEFDALIAAALLHDVTKMLETGNGLIYDPFHPYTVESLIAQCRSKDEKSGNDSHSSTLTIDEESLTLILRLIRCQKGVWSAIPETVPSTKVEWLLHFGELIATNLHYMVDGVEVDLSRWITEEQLKGGDEEE